jgi:hypothetical protein
LKEQINQRNLITNSLTKAMNLIIPEKLDTPEFRQAWMEWMEYRMGAKKKLINPIVTFRVHLRKLESFGHAGALLAIETAINKGWQGIFEIKPWQAPAKEDWIEKSTRLREEQENRLKNTPPSPVATF